MAAAWGRAAAAVSGPGFAEIEERRWGSGGRAHFADPRPDDFSGRAVQEAEPEPEPVTGGRLNDWYSP
jgi:hypothetical protein